MSTVPVPQTGGNENEILLKTQGLTKRYRSTAANNNVSVSIPRGKITGFVGENGSGKTTFLRLVTGVAFPNSGSVRFLTPDGSCRIGAVIESPAYQPNMSARDNLRFQARICGVPEDRVDGVLEIIGLADTGKKAAKHFSLGMRQRLGIGVALLCEPELLILDEPTNGLDPQGIIELREFLKNLCEQKKMTLLISSHILSELSLLAEHYIFIHKGEILRSVSAEELFASSKKQLRFRCSADPGDFVNKASANGWAQRAEITGEVCVLTGVSDYASVLRAMAELGVTDIETGEENLETRYLSLMEKEDGR